METNDNIKTIDKLSKLPVVNSAITNATDYYGKVKDKNFLFRTSCNLAELSLRTIAYAATPITSICKKPMQSVDSYLCDKVDQLESNYPIISKPTEQLTASAYTQVKELYDKTLKPPIDTIYNIKDSSFKTVYDIKSYSSNKVQDVVKLGTDSFESLRLYSIDRLSKSAQYGIKLVDACLEQKYAKMLTTPLLDLTEKSISYFLPTEEATADEDDLEKPTPTTLARLYDINTRVARHLYQATYNQLLKLNLQFEYGINKLTALNTFFTTFYENSKNKLCQNVETNKTSLKTLCNKYIDFQSISVQKLETICRQYYTTILNEVNQTLHLYLDVLKNLPIASTGTKLKKFTTEILQKLNKEPFPSLLSSTIVQLRKVHETLLLFIVRLTDPRADPNLIKNSQITIRNTSNDYKKQNNNNNNNNNNKPINIANIIVNSNSNSYNSINNNNNNENQQSNNKLFNSTIIETINKQKKYEQEQQQDQQQQLQVIQQLKQQSIVDSNDEDETTAEEDNDNDNDNYEDNDEEEEEQTSNYYSNSDNNKNDDNLNNYSANSDANKTQDLINTSTSSVASDSIHY